jgi:lysine 2,3-aminomutase
VISRLTAIAHVKVIRVHSRVPAVEPARITPELVRALKAKGKATYVVLHANHARELTEAGARGLRAAGRRRHPDAEPVGAARGVNDDPQTLGALMRALVECRVKPYYLHHGDLAPGTSHLRNLDRARPGLDAGAAAAGLTGLCHPPYVLDIPAATANHDRPIYCRERSRLRPK